MSQLRLRSYIGQLDAPPPEPPEVATTREGSTVTTDVVSDILRSLRLEGTLSFEARLSGASSSTLVTRHSSRWILTSWPTLPPRWT